MIDGLFVHQLTRRRAVDQVDRYGNTIRGWDSTDDIDFLGWVSQTGASEDVDQRDGQRSDWRMYAPAGTDVTGGDRIVWTWPAFTGDDAETVFEVVGPPNRPWRPRSGEHHVEAVLRAVTG